MINRTPTGCTHARVRTTLARTLLYVPAKGKKRIKNQQAVYVNLVHRKKERRTSFPTANNDVRTHTHTRRRPGARPRRHILRFFNFFPPSYVGTSPPSPHMFVPGRFIIHLRSTAFVKRNNNNNNSARRARNVRSRYHRQILHGGVPSKTRQRRTST